MRTTTAGDRRQLARARVVAGLAHRDQFDRVGAPYVEHLARVAARVDGPVAQTVAWLHDILEDTPVTAADLATLGFSAEVVAAVVRLTRRAPFDYVAYIADLVAHGEPLAKLVKLADLRDHLNPHCPPSLRPRYEAALAALLA